MPVVIWIDRNHARLLSFDRVPPGARDLQSSPLGHHHFMELIVNQLENASRVLIVGPGVTKYRLFSFVRETAPKIARKIVGCVELDQPHDFQMRNLAEIHLGIVSNPSKV